jgi:hypothetical protein
VRRLGWYWDMGQLQLAAGVVLGAGTPMLGLHMSHQDTTGQAQLEAGTVLGSGKQALGPHRPRWGPPGWHSKDSGARWGVLQQLYSTM